MHFKGGGWDGESSKCTSIRRKPKRREPFPCSGNVDDGQGMQFVDETGALQRTCWGCYQLCCKEREDAWEAKHKSDPVSALPQADPKPEGAGGAVPEAEAGERGAVEPRPVAEGLHEDPADGGGALAGAGKRSKVKVKSSGNQLDLF